MKLKYLFFLSPIILFLDFCMISFIAELLTKQSDMAVLIGVLSICMFLWVNYLLINYIIKQFKQKTK